VSSSVEAFSADFITRTAGQHDQCTFAALQLKNLDAVLKEAGSDSSLVLRTTVYLADIADFAAMNAAYQLHFGSTKPARATTQAAALPLGARIEIECIGALRST